MSAGLHRLKAQQISGLPDGMHGDGGNLYLRVRGGGKSRNFVFIYRAGDGKQRMKGLGVADQLGRIGLTLAEARAVSNELRAKLRDGIDPLAEAAEPQKPSVPTFGKFAETFMDGKEVGWKNEKHRAQWRMTLKVYAAPIADIAVDRVTTADVLTCIEPIWTTKPETASRTRGRIEMVLNAARVAGHIDMGAANPARFAGHLALILPSQAAGGHHKAMQFMDVPKFMARLRERPATAALACEFTILTAARSGEVLGATWPEIDLKAKLWTVPAERMKAGRDHVVPLSARAIAILRAVQPLRESPVDHVFPGQRRNHGLSNMAFEALYRRMKVDGITTHGFWSSFRDWVGERTRHPREVAEAALAHMIGDKTEAAYRRGTAIQKRRRLMEDWATFCASHQSAPAGAK